MPLPLLARARALISVNQLAQALRVMTVGYGSRVSRIQNNLYMQDFDKLYERCLDWSDKFMPSTRWEFEGLLSGNIKNEDIPAYRAETLPTTPLSCASSPGATTTGWKQKRTGHR